MSPKSDFTVIVTGIVTSVTAPTWLNLMFKFPPSNVELSLSIAEFEGFAFKVIVEFLFENVPLASTFFNKLSAVISRLVPPIWLSKTRDCSCSIFAVIVKFGIVKV